MRGLTRMATVGTLIGFLLTLSLVGYGGFQPGGTNAGGNSGATASSAFAGSNKIGAGRTLLVATWGGDWAHSLDESVGKIFREQTGAKVIYVFGNPSDNMAKLLASGGSVPFDVMEMDNYTEQFMIGRGLLDTVDLSKVPVYKELYPAALNTKEYGPAFTAIPAVIAWFPDKFRALGIPAPKTFNDLLNPKLRGKWAFPSPRVGFTPNILSGLAWSWTGDRSNVGNAISKLKTNDPMIYGATPEMTTWLANGSVIAAVTHTAQALVSQKQGLKLDFVYPDLGHGKKSMIYWNNDEIIKGTKNRDLAEIWLQIHASAAAQVAFAKFEPSVPTNTRAASEMKQDKVLAGLVITPQDMVSMFQSDPSFINDHRSAWNEDWNRIMGK